MINIALISDNKNTIIKFMDSIYRQNNVNFIPIISPENTCSHHFDSFLVLDFENNDLIQKLIGYVMMNYKN